MKATTTASQGRGPRYAPEDPTLPKPWKGLVDGSTGYLYYWNPVTNVTQYEKPVSEVQLPPPPPLPKLVPLSSVQVHQHHNDGDGRHRSHQYQGFRVSGEQRSGHGSADIGHGSSGTHNQGHGPVHSRTSTRGHVFDGVIFSADAYRRQHEITVSGEDVPAPYMTFESTGFPPEILKEVQRAGFSSPTPIQAQSWPITLQSRDVVAIAKTGSGKTIGYLFPGFVHVKRLHNNSKMGPTVLVLSPTRELATQIQDEAEKFGRSSRISCTCLYGGAPKGPQLRDLDRGVDIVVATPGRLNDILEMRRISLRQVSYLVLDEADRMLDMGFEPQIRKIVKEVPNHRQTLMFTATWPKEVRKIAADLLDNPVQVNIGNIDELVANKSITQYIEMLKPVEKQRRLEQILRSQETGSKILIFCSTKRMCDQLARTLTRQFVAVAIHGDKSQSDRDRVLNQFKTGRSPILVATDVAARGLDIKDIRVVINYDFPTGVEDYVHRIGRTGRAGATGVSYTFFCDHDSKYAWDLVKVLEGADQHVPPELRDMAARGGHGGKSRRWGYGGSNGRDRGRFGTGRGESTIGGRSGRAPSPSSRLDNGHVRNTSGRDRDTRDRNSRLDGRALDKSGQSNDKGTLRGSDRSRSPSRSRSYSPSPIRGLGALGSGRSRSRSRSRSHSVGRNNGKPVMARLSGKVSPPRKRKETSMDNHHRGGSPLRKRRETSNDRYNRKSPQPKRDVRTPPPRKEISNDVHRGPSSPKGDISLDRRRGTSPPKKEISNDRYRRPTSPKRNISNDHHHGDDKSNGRHRVPSSPKRDRSNDRQREPSSPKRDISIVRHRRPPSPKRELSVDHHRGPLSPKREISIDHHRAPPSPKRDISTDRHRGASSPKRDISTDRHRGASSPKRGISTDRRRAPSPHSRSEILIDRRCRPSPSSNLQNSPDDQGTTSPLKSNVSVDRYHSPSQPVKIETLNDCHHRLSPSSRFQASAVNHDRASPPKRDISVDHHRSPSPQSKGVILADGHRSSSPPSNLQNLGDESIPKNESLIQEERASDVRRPVLLDGSPPPPRHRSQSPPYRQQTENGSGRVLASSEQLSWSPSHVHPETETDRPRTPMQEVIVSEKLNGQIHNCDLKSGEPFPQMYQGVIESAKLCQAPAAAPENGEEEEEGLIPADEEEGILLTGSRGD